MFERRSDRRYAFSRNIRVSKMSLYGSKKLQRSFPGQLHDLSSGGCCLLLNREVEVSDLIRCDMQFFDLPVRIPILCRVRWIQKTRERKRYRVGGQFVI